MSDGSGSLKQQKETVKVLENVIVLNYLPKLDLIPIIAGQLMKFLYGFFLTLPRC